MKEEGDKVRWSVMAVFTRFGINYTLCPFLYNLLQATAAAIDKETNVRMYDLLNYYDIYSLHIRREMV